MNEERSVDHEIKEETLKDMVAIVTDVGGMLSHGSIVAREYGIPAVLGTGAATMRIHSGQLIMVDGSTGIVTLSPNGNH